MSSSFHEQLLDSLLGRWGYVMNSGALRLALGYPNQAALRTSVRRGTVPVHVFQIVGRRGYFALTHEVAQWLAAQEPARGARGGS